MDVTCSYMINMAKHCSVIVETLINNHRTSRALLQHNMHNNVSIVHHSTSPFSRAYLVV